MASYSLFSKLYHSNIIMVSIACIVRALVFICFIQHHDPVSHHPRFWQPDTAGYHHAALSIAAGNGMHHVITKKPIFWRVPGYPLYLALFYKLFGTSAEHISKAQGASLWLQILISSLTPLIIFLLASVITHNPVIAGIAAWISVFHLGLVLSSTFLLTEAISLPLFFLFLFFFFRILSTKNTTAVHTISAAICLALFTWIRPMGEFVAIIALVLMLLFTPKNKPRIKTLLLFACCFFACIAPWYVRNYRLTNQFVFCPMLGLYLNSFVAPKIVSRAQHIPLLQAYQWCAKEAQYKQLEALASQKKYAIIPEQIPGLIAWPLIKAHPWYTLYDWCIESCKTLFDLYSSQHLVAYANHTFHYDPLQESLITKTKQALYAEPMSFGMRALCWLEFLLSCTLWLGIALYCYHFLRNLCKTRTMSQQMIMGLVCIILIGFICGVGGGFGYARLRLPAEPLLIILSLMGWFHVILKKKHLIEEQTS